jgi:hypothetical protein
MLQAVYLFLAQGLSIFGAKSIYFWRKVYLFLAQAKTTNHCKRETYGIKKMPTILNNL